MNNKIKKTSLALLLAVPFVLSSTASASSLPKNSEVEKNNQPVYETRSVGVNPSLADGSYGGYRVPVSKTLKYPLGSSYPTSVYAETYYKNQTLSGYIPVASASVQNGYLVVHYYGILTN